MNDREKAQVFVKHIENHLEKENPNYEVICKFCGATIDEIYNKFLERMGELESKPEKHKVLDSEPLTQKQLGEGI